MGNTIQQKNSFNLRERDDLNQFLSNINMLDGFYMDTCMSISSKCLVFINNLINDGNRNTVKLMSGLEIEQDEFLCNRIEKLKFHCGLIRHLSVVNSAVEAVEELVELNNVLHLTSLTLDHVPIRYVQHLRKHRPTLLKLSVHHSIVNLESLIDLCGGDFSFSDKWTNLLHLDVRYNHLQTIGDSVQLLVALTVLDISRNEISDLSFIQKIPTLVCLNASFNYVRFLPKVSSTNLRVLILGYNYLDGLEGINGFKFLSTLNVSFNMITSNDYLQQLKEMDSLNDLVLRGNPIFYSPKYRTHVLDVISPHVSFNFAIDGKCLTKLENVYLHKGPMIVIAPALSPPTTVYKAVPIMVVNRSDVTSDDAGSDVPSGANSYAKRNINRPRILNQSDVVADPKDNTDPNPLLRNSNARAEKMIDSVSGMDTFVSSITFDDDVIPEPKYEVISCIEDSTFHNPYYVGDKNSNFFIVMPDKPWNSFASVSVQIIEHKLMIVDRFDVIVDNSNLWQLVATTTNTLHQDSHTDNVLKLVLFVPSHVNDNDSFVLCTKTVEFTDAQKMKKFSDQLTLYLNGFSISYDDWNSLPLSNVSINCKICYKIIKPTSDKMRQYKCTACSGTNFIIQTNVLKSRESQPVSNSPVKIMQDIAQSPALNKTKKKSSTSNLVTRTFGSQESLSRKKSEISDTVQAGSSYTAKTFQTSLDVPINLKSSSAMFHSQEQLIDRSFDSTLGTVTPLDEPDQDRDHCDRGSSLNLEVPISIQILESETNIVPHDEDEHNVDTMLKSALRTPWVIYEPSCEINLHMHNTSKMDDRVKLYFLTKVMQDHEDLIGVFKVFLSYKSSGLTIGALIVLSDLRIILFSLLDKVSPNMDDCLKLVQEFPLTNLQQLEYCINNQWIELQFKGKPTVTLLIGDSDSIKDIGLLITDLVTKKSASFSVSFSKELSKLKSPQTLLAMTSGINDGVTVDTLNIAESYLIRSCSALPITEKSSLEYAPKMMVIETEHIFFITFTYSGKGHQPVFELCHTIGLYSVKNNLIIDSLDTCVLRLLIFENGQNKTVDIKFISPRTRSKAVRCIERMLNDMFRVEIIFSVQECQSGEPTL